jgi:hypothetical protein
MTAPTKGGGDGGEVNVSCDDELRAYDATGTGQTLEISNNHYVASTAGSLVTITSTAYDQYGAGIAGVNTKVTQQTDGGSTANLAVITSNAQGKASTSTVVCASGSQANGTEAFAVAAAGGQMKNIAATAPNAGGVATVEGTTVYCSTAYTNASTAGGDGYGPVTDVQEIQKVAFKNGAGTITDAAAGNIKCIVSGGAGPSTTAVIGHNVAANATVFTDLNNNAGSTITLFAGNSVSLDLNSDGTATAMPTADVAGGGFYLTFAANTGNHPAISCGDQTGGDGDDFTDGSNPLEAEVTTLREGVPAATSTIIDDNPVENTLLMSTVTKTTAANGTSADSPAVYRSATWDTTNDQFNGQTGPGLTEAAFEAELAAITNATTVTSGMIRTVATGTGISVFQIGA